MADSPSVVGGVEPDAGAGGTTPLPPTSRISPGLSETSLPPACQIPPPGLPISGGDGGTSASSVHRAVIGPPTLAVPCVEIPMTQPRYGGMSQCPPNAAYTTPFINNRPGRWRCCVASNAALGSLSALPWSNTGKLGRSFPVARSIACAYQAARPADPLAYVFETTYAVFVAESIAGVEVTPTDGVMSTQFGSRSAGFQAGPRFRVHNC